MEYFNEANRLKEEMILHRRYLHQNAEVGMELPLAQSYVMKQLASMGIHPIPCAGGVSAVIGQGDKTILLRADMDALPMAEQSGLPFACQTGTAAHTCGHDLHTAMLLGAAKLLKCHENSLHGKVKLMFQTGEELLHGAAAMIAEGILNDPKPDAALALHVGPSGSVGEFCCNAHDNMMLSCDAFRITVEGRGGHSGYPHHAADPIGAAVQIYEALQHLVNYEADPTHTALLIMGSFHAGTAYNIIPQTAVLQGSIRTDDEKIRAHLTKRVQEIAVQIAASCQCRAHLTSLAANPPLRCDPQFTQKILGFMKDLPLRMTDEQIRTSGSDDFAEITSRIPSAYFFLSAGVSPQMMSHHPKVQFDEAVLPYGAAILAHCADAWLYN